MCNFTFTFSRYLLKTWTLWNSDVTYSSELIWRLTLITVTFTLADSRQPRLCTALIEQHGPQPCSDWGQFSQYLKTWESVSQSQRTLNLLYHQTTLFFLLRWQWTGGWIYGLIKCLSFFFFFFIYTRRSFRSLRTRLWSRKCAHVPGKWLQHGVHRVVASESIAWLDNQASILSVSSRLFFTSEGSNRFEVSVHCRWCWDSWLQLEERDTDTLWQSISSGSQTVYEVTSYMPVVFA